MNCYLSSNKYMTIKDGFYTSNSSDTPTIKFTVPGLRNPRTLAPTSTFYFLIYDTALQYVLYNYNSTLYTTMTSTGAMK
jgi:hypothetical protein